MKVRWKRQSDNLTVPEVDEGLGWKPYHLSKLYRRDNHNFSKGYLTFLACLNAGYEVLKMAD